MELYKYLSLDTFIEHVLLRGTILFQSVQNWPDCTEGKSLEVARALEGLGQKISPHTEELLAGNTLGCCWSLEHDCEEFKRFGSDAMWQIYCRDGGVRIKTSFKKLEQALEGNGIESEKQIARKVTYGMSSGTHIDQLFQKKKVYQHESEYRVILQKMPEPVLKLNINPIRFIDEVMISPLPIKMIDSNGAYDPKSIKNILTQRAIKYQIRAAFQRRLNSDNLQDYCDNIKFSALYGEMNESGDLKKR